MIEFNDFKNYKTFDDFINNGEILNITSDIPHEYYKEIKMFFE